MSFNLQIFDRFIFVYYALKGLLDGMSKALLLLEDNQFEVDADLQIGALP